MELQLPMSDVSFGGGALRLRVLFRRRDGSRTAGVHPRGQNPVPGQSQGDAWALGLRGDFRPSARSAATVSAAWASTRSKLGLRPGPPLSISHTST